MPRQAVRLIRRAALCLLVLCVARAASAGTETIRIRVAEFPPQYYRDASGEWTGIDVELAKALVEAAGFKAEFVDLPWSRGIADLGQGRVDLMMNLSITPDREEIMRFIGPERMSSKVLVVREGMGNLPIRTLDDLPGVSRRLGRNFGIQDDVIYSRAFSDRMRNPDFARYFESVPASRLNNLKLSSDRILGFFEDRLTVAYQLARNPEWRGLAMHPFALQESAVYFGVSRKVDQAVFQRLRQACEALEKDGTFARIAHRVWE